MKLVSILIIFAGMFFANSTFSQNCRKFAKKDCRPAIAPYIHNGQLNNANLFEGDKAEIMLTFYSGQKYRLLVCSQEQLGDVYFIIKDVDKNEIYNSEGKNSNLFDFKVASTQQLIVEVNVPESANTHDIDFQGCVSIMVGFQE